MARKPSKMLLVGLFSVSFFFSFFPVSQTTILWKSTHQAQSKDSAPHFLSGGSVRQLSELASCLPVWTASPPVVYVLQRMLCCVPSDPAAAGCFRPEVTV